MDHSQSQPLVKIIPQSSLQNFGVWNHGVENSPAEILKVQNQTETKCNKNIIKFHCRFCGEEKSHDDLLHLDEDNQTLQDYFQKLKYLNIDYIDLSNNLLPKTTCECCSNALDKAFEFFKKVKRAQDKLIVLYNTRNEIEIKVEDVESYLNPAEYEESATDVAEYDNHTSLVEYEFFKKETEDFVFNCDELTQPHFSGGSNSAQIITPKPPGFSKLCKTNSNTLKTETDLVSEVITTKIDNNVIQSSDTAEKPDEKAAVPKSNAEEISWENYKWSCLHCNEEFNNMSEVRDHSKEVHSLCYGFKCAFCTEWFKTFNAFVEHARGEHCETLRLYCQYCFSKFESAEQCVSHTFSHWIETKVCEHCGEILPNSKALERHVRVYKKIKKKPRIARRLPKIVATCTGSWEDYEWSCQDCWMRLPNVSSLRAHVRDVHDKCFSMKCADCLLVVSNYKQFVDHVRDHRPHLRHYCQFCNMYFGEEHDLARHIEEHWSSPQPPCHGCGEIFAENAGLMQHLEQYSVHSVKGVPHATVNNTYCAICRKKFYNTNAFRSHMQAIHKKHYHHNFICHTCGKEFQSNSSLKDHEYAHGDKKEECKLCGKVFAGMRRLKEHARTHLKEKPFKCDVCGNSFHRKSNISNHMQIHLNIKPHKCLSCDKTFITKSKLKIHERQHSGERPYSCRVCERTFSCWGNCNKHMIRMHGVTLAKTKVTKRGRIDINTETGEPKNITSDKNAEKWLSEIIKPMKRKS